MTESLDDLVWRNFRSPVGKADSRAAIDCLAADPNWRILQVENKLCGDSIVLAMSQTSNHVLLQYAATGCSLCIASASVLANEVVQVLTREHLARVVSEFLECLAGKQKNLPESPALLTLLQIKDFPVRLKCVRLAWEAARQLLVEFADGSGKPQSTLSSQRV